MKRIYNACAPCCDSCPVVDYDEKQGVVVIHDPAKPERGRFECTAIEFNALLTGATPVPQ